MVTAYLNHGRWVADCVCNAGLLVRRAGRHRCGLCGEYTEIELPAEWAQIQHLVRNRPPENRNWFPGEPLAHLAAENIEHGVRGNAAERFT